MWNAEIVKIRFFVNLGFYLLKFQGILRFANTTLANDGVLFWFF